MTIIFSHRKLEYDFENHFLGRNKRIRKRAQSSLSAKTELLIRTKILREAGDLLIIDVKCSTRMHQKNNTKQSSLMESSIIIKES